MCPDLHVNNDKHPARFGPRLWSGCEIYLLQLSALTIPDSHPPTLAAHTAPLATRINEYTGCCSNDNSSQYL